MVSAIYWPLILFAPSLILPPAEQSTPGSVEPSSAEAAKPALAFVPMGLDLALHAAPAISLLVDFFLLERRYSAKQVRTRASLLAIASGVWYGSWVEHCATHNKTCAYLFLLVLRRVITRLNCKRACLVPYPFLNVPFTGRVTIYASATMIAYLMFLALNALHPGKPATSNIPAVQKVVDPRRSD